MFIFIVIVVHIVSSGRIAKITTETSTVYSSNPTNQSPTPTFNDYMTTETATTINNSRVFKYKYTPQSPVNIVLTQSNKDSNQTPSHLHSHHLAAGPFAQQLNMLVSVHPQDINRIISIYMPSVEAPTTTYCRTPLQLEFNDTYGNRMATYTTLHYGCNTMVKAAQNLLYFAILLHFLYAFYFSMSHCLHFFTSIFCLGGPSP